MLIVGGGMAALIIYLLARAAMAPSMALLYSGLDPSAANGVIEGLERQGLAYEVRGDAIYVPSSERDRARIRLAGEGLPAAGAAGYELLDGLSGFGTTAEMFDAAYWRAKEGELARTVLAAPYVTRARVHIAQSRRRPFEAATPVTASITVATSSGALTKPQAEAIRHLVGSAVAGLSNNEVAVIDQERGVVLKAGEGDAETLVADDAASRGAALRANVTRLLEARVGTGAAIVEVAVDTARSSETVRERILDPDRRVAIHSETEKSEGSSSGGADAVTVASNLPDGDVEGDGDSSSRQTSQTRERANYEVSETIRESVQPPGRVERISVAVMVDGVRSIGANGDPTWTPRPQEELDALAALVKSAIGFNEERGDVVTIETLEFTQIEGEGSVASGGFGAMISPHMGMIAQIAALAVAAAVVGLFILRPILAARPAAIPELASANDGEDGLLLEATADDDAGESFSTGDGGGELGDFGGGDDFGFAPEGAAMGGFLPAPGAGEDDLRAQVDAAINSRPEKAVEIISEWLDATGAEREKEGAAA